MTPAIVYARWSPRPHAEDCLSIETQLDRCRNYCQGNEYEIVQEYQEPNVSGDMHVGVIGLPCHFFFGQSPGSPSDPP